MSDHDMTYCHKCDRGGNGNAKDKCSAGWKHTKPTLLGCFLGTAIVGEPKKQPKVSKAKERYRRYLDVCECFDSFLDFLYWEAEDKRERAMR
jgi:hypothetical protein